MTRARRLLVPGLCLAALLALAAACLLAAIHTRGLGVADDAFISFRMARNLADGHGLRFNPSGPPVEAASNFLLTVALAGAHRLGLSLIQSAVAIGLLSSALALVLLAWCCRRHVGAWGLLAPAGLATVSIAAGNATNGLETSLFTLLLLLAVVLYVEGDAGPRPRRRLLFASSLVLALVAMTRPEGPMYLVALGVLRGLDLWRRRRAGRGARRTLLTVELWWIAGFLVLYLPYTAWRVGYFGMLLPNTYHAKEMQFVELSKLHAGLLYLKLMLLREPLLPVGLALGALAHAIAPDRRMRVLLALTVTQCLFMVLCGGDWPHMFGFGRFLMPVMPLLLWITAEACARLLKLRRRITTVGVVLGLVAVCQLDLVAAADMRMPPQYHLRARTAPTAQALRTAYVDAPRRLPADEWWRRSLRTLSLGRYENNFDAVVGRWLRRRYGSETTIASIQAGQFAFWSRMPMLDMFGLASPEVTRLGSHEPAGLARVLRQFDPTLIAFYKWSAEVHHRGLVQSGFLDRAGYGLRYVFVRQRFRAFVVFEKGYRSPEDPREVLFATLRDLPYRVNRDRLIAALDVNHPRL